MRFEGGSHRQPEHRHRRRARAPRPVLLRDALRVLLVLAVADRDRHAPAAARRCAPGLERKLSVAEAQLAFAALQTLAGADPLAGGEALSVLLDRHGEHEGARYLEEWLKPARGGRDRCARPMLPV